MRERERGGGVGFAVWAAVCDPSCPLPPELRHLVQTMAWLGNRRTGRGYAGQERIAQAMGVNRRTVQRLLAQLAACSDSPVAVVRRPRMRRDGRGRSSDEYQLVLVRDQSDSRVALETTDQHDRRDALVQRDQSDSRGSSGAAVASTKATASDDQCDKPGRTNATTVSHDPGSDPVCDPGSIPSRDCATAPAAEFSLAPPPASKPRRRRAPECPAAPKVEHMHTPEQRAAHKLVVAAYAEVFEQKTGRKLDGFDGADGDAVYRLLAKCKTPQAAITIVRNAVLSDFGGSTSIRTIAADPKRFAVLNRRQTNGHAHRLPPQEANTDAARKAMARSMAGGLGS